MKKLLINVRYFLAPLMILATMFGVLKGWPHGYWTGLALLGVGIGCLAIVWLISNFELVALNYIEHYGLIREKGQPIDYRHSWENSTAFTSLVFHSDWSSRGSP